MVATMTMSTQTLDESGRTLAAAVLRDSLQIYNVGPATTTGFQVTRALTAVGQPIPGLVQTTTLENAVESRTTSSYSVKVARGTTLSAGQAIRVVTCLAEPALVGKTLLLDKISLNGLALIRKGVAGDFDTVNQEGKGDLA